MGLALAVTTESYLRLNHTPSYYSIINAMATAATLSSLLVTVTLPVFPLVSFLSTSAELCPFYQKPVVDTLNHGELQQNIENKSYNVHLSAVCYIHKMIMSFQPTTKEIDVIGVK